MALDYTHDQQVMLSHWWRYGSASLVLKVKRGWIISNEGILAPLGNVPVVFKTKRAAMDYADNLVSIRAKEWRGIDPSTPQPEGLNPEEPGT